MALFKSELWPKEAPRATHSEAEKRVYTALQSGLPKGWIAWHSLRLRTDKESKFSEADFVFADPYRPSILILEVKGGQIEEREGQWFQNGRTLYRLPLDQAHSFRKRLIECSRQDSFHLPTIDVAVCFPDTFFSKQPTQYDLHGLVIGGQDLPYLDTILCKVMDRAVPNPWQVDGPWINRLHELWGETWVPKLKLGERIEFDSDQRVQLDKQQLELLDMIEDNKRVFITGAAGTGKSLLAREVALRQAEKGDKVLVLWFTNALKSWFEKEICHPRVTCAPIRYFAAGLLNEEGPDRLLHELSEYWESVSWRAACEGLPIRDDLWDFVIIDEGQDFSEEDWLLAFECSQKSDRLWVFADEMQAFWQDRRMPGDLEKDFFHCQLQKSYRCAPAIQHLTDWQLKKRCEKILYCRQYCDLIPKRRDRR